MDVISEKYLATKVDEAIFSGKGTLITIADETLNQINTIAEIYKKAGNYGKVRLTQDDLFQAEMLLDQFAERGVTGIVVDNVLQPMPKEMFDMALDSIKEWVAHCPVGLTLPIILTAQVMNERKSFYR